MGRRLRLSYVSQRLYKLFTCYFISFQVLASDILQLEQLRRSSTTLKMLTFRTYRKFFTHETSKQRPVILKLNFVLQVAIFFKKTLFVNSSRFHRGSLDQIWKE